MLLDRIMLIYWMEDPTEIRTLVMSSRVHIPWLKTHSSSCMWPIMQHIGQNISYHWPTAKHWGRLFFVVYRSIINTSWSPIGKQHLKRSIINQSNLCFLRLMLKMRRATVAASPTQDRQPKHRTMLMWAVWSLCDVTTPSTGACPPGRCVCGGYVR